MLFVSSAFSCAIIFAEFSGLDMPWCASTSAVVMGERTGCLWAEDCRANSFRGSGKSIDPTMLVESAM